MAKSLQEIIRLTPEQNKAWKRLEKAMKDFLMAGGEFYTVLETVYGYNGEHVQDISYNEGHCTQDVFMPSIMNSGLSGFADDWHGFVLKDGVEVSEGDCLFKPVLSASFKGLTGK